METLVIRNVEAALHARLKARAASRGRSMEEVRRVLRESFGTEPVPAEESPWAAIRVVFESFGGVELDIERQPGQRPPPDFSGPGFGVNDAGPSAAVP